MGVEPVGGPHGEGEEVVADGQTATGKQRLRCQNEPWERRTLLRAYSDQGCLPAVKPQMVEMTLNGSGVRDIPGPAEQSDHRDGRVKQKAPALPPINQAVVEGCCPEAITVEVRRVEGAAVDEMWSFVGSKAHRRWLWHAINHLTGVVLAYVLGTRAEAGFTQVQALLQPFGIVQFYPEAAGVYERHLPAAGHTVGKVHTQQIERKHLTLRTRLKRLARKTMCFSKSVLMHEVVIGLSVNHY
jgi:insertion element IS1 protein InsB